MFEINLDRLFILIFTLNAAYILYITSKICLNEHDDLKSIYTQLENHDKLEDINVETLSEKLAEVTSIPIEKNDGFPEQICAKCVYSLHEAHKFKIYFTRSYAILKNYISECDLEKSNLRDAADGEEKVNVRSTRSQVRKRKVKLKNNLVNLDEETLKIVLHTCPVCTSEFTAAELKLHVNSHKALKRYLNIPNENKVGASTRFYRLSNPNKATINIHYRENKLHTCPLCGEEYTALDLQKHLENHRNQKEYKCDQCTRVFKQLNHLNTHKVKHLKEYPFKCEICKKGFVIERNYECHVLTHNTDRDLPHECEHCLKRFSNPEHLKRHSLIHTENVTYSVKYRVCKCHLCLNSFKDKDELKGHHCVPVARRAVTHFSCKTCGKTFQNSRGLYNHNRTVHKTEGVKELCSVCGNRVSNIYNHMMRHSGEKRYQCSQCGKKFMGKPQLRQHLLVHSGLKPFVCSVCAKAFNNLYNLQVHERIHKGNRCHICNICGKGFLEKSYLKKHMNVHAKL